MTRELRTLADDLAFGEGPRWRDGQLYFSDIHADRVAALRPDGACETVASFPGPVSGLGWLPDGRLLVVSMHDKRVLRREAGGEFVTHADLSDIATGYANDMVVAADGTAFVGNFGFSLHPRGEPRMAVLARVTPDGQVSVAADGLAFPNGAVITPDGGTIVVAESVGRRLTAFDLSPDGGLANRREWAGMPDGAFPDGICLDAEGAIWVASPPTREVLRMRQGGEIVERIATRQQAIACMLGGVDRKTLFILTADSIDPAWCRANHTARLEAAIVDVPGAGLP